MLSTAERDTSTSDLEELSDADLLARYVAERSERAFTVLYKRWTPRLRAYAAKKIADRHRAEVLVQETWRKVFEHAHRFSEEKGQFSTWAFHIITNLCRNEYRNRGRDPQVNFSTLSKHHDETDRPLQFADHSSTPERAWERSRARELVEDALFALKPHHRAALVLLELRGCSYRRTAELLGLHLGTVKSRKHRALGFYREALERLSDRAVTEKEGRVRITGDGNLAWTHPERENESSPWSLMQKNGDGEAPAPHSPEAVRAGLHEQGWTLSEDTGHWLQPSKKSARVFLDELVDLEPELVGRWFVGEE